MLEGKIVKFGKVSKAIGTKVFKMKDCKAIWSNGSRV